MNQTVRALRLDLWCLRPYMRTYVLIVGALCLLGIVLGNPYQGAWPFAFLGVFAPLALFQVGERFHLGVLYAQVPLSRGATVLGKYLVVVLTLAITPVIGAAVGWVMSLVLRTGFSWGLALGSALLIGAVVAVVWAVQAPLYFALPYAKARMWTILPLAVLAGGMGGFMSTLDPAGTNMLWSSPGSLWRMVALAGGFAVLAMVVSAWGSVRLYSRRDL